MRQQPATIYANVVNVKTTPNELVFEFGSIFPEGPAQQPTPGRPIQFDPEVRIVLAVPALQMLVDVLHKALQQRQAAVAGAQPEPPRAASKQ